MLLTRYITFRSLATRKLRTLLTLFAIALGVAGMFSIHSTNHSAYISITRLFEGTSGRVSLEVRSAAQVGGIPQELLEVVQTKEGIVWAVPILILAAALPGETPAELDLNFFGAGAGGLILHGIHPEGDLKVRDYKITQGRFLSPGASSREVVLVEDYAREKEIAVGQDVTILTASGLVDLKVVGFIARDGAGLTNMGKFGVLELALAQELAEREGELDHIDIVAGVEGGPDLLEELRQALIASLGKAYTVVYPASQGDRMAQMLSGYQIGLNFMAGIALFVGAFLIYNAFSMTVVERTRELGLLRSVGMTRRQVTAQVMIEGVLLGALGAVAGAVGGVLMFRGLVELMSQIMGQELEAGGLPLGIMAGSMAVGIVVTLLAAALPARQAGRISPLEALRLRGRSDDRWLLQYGWIAGAALLAVSAGILIWNPFPYDVQFRLGSLTVFALFLGAMLVIPVTLQAWQFLWRWPLRLVFGGVGDIGTRNLERAHKRTMLTCAALLVGVSMIVVTQGMTGSFTADLYPWIDAYIGGDLILGSSVPLNRDLKDKLESLAEVDTAAPVRYIQVSWQGEGEVEELSFMAVEPDSYTAVTRFVFSDPEIEGDKAVAELGLGRTLFISSVISEKYGLKPGDDMNLVTREGEKEFRVAAVVLDFFNQGLGVTGNWADLEEFFDIHDVNTFLIKGAEGVEIQEVMNRIAEDYQEEYQLVIESNRAIKERADELMNQAFGMFDILGIIAVMVAALGVVNTLSMSVVERTREIGMLRSMGMTRFQVVLMILAEAALLGIIGGLLGLGFGVVLTRIFLAAMGAMSGYVLPFILPVRAFWLSLIVALFTSQLAALLPALRAARTPMLSAIHHE